MSTRSGRSESDASSSDMDDDKKKKRRQELNELEKIRVMKINEQMDHLRNIVETAGIATKRDKYSILSNTLGYVEDLQRQVAAYEDKLAELNSAKTAMVTAPPAAVAIPAIEEPTGVYSSSAVFLSPSSLPSTLPPTSMPLSEASTSVVTPLKREEDTVFESFFRDAGVPMVVTGLDSQFLECNRQFSLLSGYSSEELRRFSLFNITPAEDIPHVYEIFDKMLGGEMKSIQIWNRCRFRGGEIIANLTVTLIQNAAGEPLYFHFIVLPITDTSGVKGLQNAMELKGGGKMEQSPSACGLKTKTTS